MLTEKLCSMCRTARPVSSFNRATKSPDGLQCKCRDCSSRYAKNWWIAKGRDKYLLLKAEVCVAYGGRCSCQHCDETEIEFLSVDHIHGDGALSKRAGEPSGQQFFKWLKEQGFPKDRYQLMCTKCNMAKGQGLVCPHERWASRSSTDDSIQLHLFGQPHQPEQLSLF